MYVVDIIDDHKMFANAIAKDFSLYNSHIQIGVVKHSAHEYLEYLQSHPRHTPHVTIIDYRLPGLLGWHLSYLLQQQRPEIYKLGISGDIVNEWINNFVAAGCLSFVSKYEPLNILAQAVICAAQGNCFYNHYFTKQMQLAATGLPINFPFGLTDKEFFYIHLCQTQLTNDAIASLLDIKFEKEHQMQKQLFKRFEVQTKAHLVQVALMAGIIKHRVRVA